MADDIFINDSGDDAFMITRGIYDGQSAKAWTKISGFLWLPDGLYERFDKTAFNMVVEMEKVQKALLDIGWKNVYFAQIQDLKTPLDNPEKGRTRVNRYKPVGFLQAKPPNPRLHLTLLRSLRPPLTPAVGRFPPN